MADRPSKDKEQRASATEAADKAATEGHVTGEQPKVTVAEGEVPGTPSNTAPGDAPADTWDAKEQVSTVLVSGDMAAGTIQEFGPGNVAVVSHVKTGDAPVAGVAADRDESQDRYEEYEVGGVRVRRNVETGESVRL
jgi:hypothetical protein